MIPTLRRLAGAIALTLLTCGPLAAATLDAVKERGKLRCGVSTGLAGFAQADASGRWKGLDVDMCRATAAAVLGDAEQVQFVPLTAKTRLGALGEGKVDVLAHNTTWTLERDSSPGVAFAAINYYDGQGFLVPRSMKLRSALQLDGAKVCVQEATTSEANVKQYFVLNRMGYELVPVDTPEASLEAYKAGRCQVITSDQSQLYALRSQLDDPDGSLVLPEVISKEPLSLAVPSGDEAWLKIVRWVLFAMVNAEELQISSQNVDRVKEQAKTAATRRLLGLDGGIGTGLGLDELWAYRVLKQVGNYGESFERNLGEGSGLDIGRGLNSLWREGGLMYAPPML